MRKYLLAVAVVCGLSTGSAFAQIDLAITGISDSPNDITLGTGNVVYSISTTNNTASSTATNVILTVNLPASSTFVSASATGGGSCSGTGPVTCNWATQSQFSSYSATITVTPGAAGTNTLTASLTADQSDPTPANNSDSETTTVNDQIDLQITSTTDSPNDITLGTGNVQYFITTYNASTSKATNAALTINLPASSTFVSASATGGGTCSGTGPVTCNWADHFAFSSYSTTITVTPGAAGTNTLSASVAATQTDPVPGNNTDSEATTVNDQIDLQITSITDSPNDITLGTGNVQYFISTYNASTSKATNAALTINLPASSTLVSASATGGGTCVGTGPVTCNWADHLAFNSFTTTITVTPGAAGTNTLSASVAATQTDPVPANNNDSEATTVNDQIDLQLSSITDSPNDITLGTGNVQYFISTYNASTSKATNAALTINLPASSTLVSATATGGGTCSGSGPVTCNWTDHLAFNSFTTTITVTPGAAGTNTLSASVAATQPDPVPGNNSDSEATTVNDQIDLQISSITDSPNDITLGTGNVQYFIQTYNASTSKATNAALTINLPASSTLVSATATGGGTCSGTGPVTCNWADHLAFNSFTTTITVTPGAGGTNTLSASVTATQPDPVPGNNSDSEATTVNSQIDLQISGITDSPASLQLGTGNVQYFIQTFNASTSKATNAALTINLPAASSFVSASATGSGTCSGTGPVTCNWADHFASNSYTTTITVTPTAAGTMTLSASLAATQSDPATGNNSDTEVTSVTPNAVPSITSFTPSSGAIGTPVTIGGSNFTGATSVKFTSNVNAGFTVVNDSTITTTVPSGATTGSVQITNAIGTGTSAGTFTVSATNISSAQSGPWTTTSTWVGGVVPTSIDHATINSGHNVSISGSLAIDTLTLNGTISGGGTLTISNVLNWNNGGAFNNGGGTVILSGTGTINSTASVDLFNFTFTNNGTLTWPSAATGFMFFNQATFNNAGTFDLQNNNGMTQTCCAAPVFNNTGTVQKSVATGTTTISGSFNNNGGTITLGTATLEVGSGSSISGAGSLSSGTMLFSNGGTIANGASYGSSNGKFKLTGGTLTAAAGSSTIKNFEITGGTLSAAGTLTISSALNYTGGFFNGGGTVNSQGNAQVSGSGHDFYNFTFNNQGILAWSSGGFTFNQATINNTGTFDIQFDGLMNQTCCAGPTFNNNAGGHLKKTGGSGTATFMTGGNWNQNGGDLEILSGSMSTTATFNVGASGGNWLGTSTGDLTLGGGGASNGDLVVPASRSITFTGGTQTLSSGADWSGGTFKIAGGRLDVNATGTLNTPNLEISSGFLGGSGTKTVTTSFLWTGGAVNGGGTGTLTIANTATGTMNNTGGSLDLFNHALVNDGTLTWAATATAGCTFNQATFTNNGTFILQNNHGLTWTCCSQPVFTNNGTIQKSATGTSFFQGTFANNGGTLDLGTGTIENNNASSSLSGVGSLASGTLVFNAGGTIANGADYTTGTGALKITGGTTTVAAGTSQIKNLKIAGGTLSAAGGAGLTITTDLDYTSGNMYGSGGSVTLNGNATLSTAAQKDFFNFTFNNQGNVIWSGGAMNFNQATINNTGLFDIQHDSTMTQTCCGSPTFNNNPGGTVRKSGGAGNHVFMTAGNWNNNGGTLEILSGTMSTGAAFNVGALGMTWSGSSTGNLTLNGGGSSSGDLVVPSGRTLIVNGGTESLASGADWSGNAFRISGGRLDVNGTATLVATDLEISGGLLGGSGNSSVAQNFLWTNGGINGAGGTFTIANTATGTWNNTSGTTDMYNMNIVNNGALTWLAGAGGTFFNQTTFTNNGNVIIQNDQQLNHSCCGSPTFINNGTLTKNTGTGTTTFNGTFTNSGIVDILSGQITVTGSFNQNSSGHLKFGIGGAAPLTGYGRLNLSNAINFNNSTSTAYTAGAYVPPGGQQFTVVTASSTSGTFATQNLTFGSGRSFVPTFPGNAYVLTASGPNVTSVAPNIGSTSGGTAVTINGANFAGGINLAVDFGGSPCTGPTVTSPATITCTTTAHAGGPVTVTVTNGDGQPGSLASGFTYAAADLTVTKGASVGSVAVGGSVTFTIGVSNAGPLTATGIVVSDPLPPGMTATSATSTVGTCSGTTNVSCNVGTLGAGNAATITIVADANTGGTKVNTATATFIEGDTNPADNSASTTVYAVGGSTLVVTSANASGNGTLSQAIADANAGICVAPCTITFNLSPIAPILGPQPSIAAAMHIDGTTQPGYSGTPLVEINGSSATPGSIGLNIGASGSSVRGLTIDNFGGSNSKGIAVQSSAIGVQILDNRMFGNSIGIDLGNDGPTGNDAGDADGGANQKQNYPVVSSAVINAGTLTLTATVDSPGSGSTLIQVFKAVGSEGETLLGSACLATPITNATFSVPAGALIAGQAIVTTATAYNGAGCTAVADGTSEFSAPFGTAGCTPPDATITAAGTICANTSGNAASVPLQGGATYAWSIINGTFTSATNGHAVTYTAGATGTTTLNVTVTTAPGCATSNSHNATIVPAPNTTITAPASVCANASFVASIPSQAGATYSWNVTNGTITSSSLQNSVNITAGATGNVTAAVTVSLGGCTTGNSHTATINALPSAAITAPASTCPSTAGLAASVPTTAGATYSWSITNGTITSATNVDAITFTAGASGTTTLNVTVTANGCASSASHNVMITANPAPTITAPATACANSPGNTATVPSQAGATYAWSITNGTITSATNGNGISFTAGASGTTTVSVTITLSGCTSNGSHNVAITPPPNTTISAPASVCANSTSNAASVPAQAGATYAWTITNGVITSATNANAITFTAGPSGNVVLGVTVMVSGCVNTGSATVATTTAPSVTITAPPSTCPSTAGLAASVGSIGGATYAWSIANGTITSATNTNTITFTAGASGTTTLSITVTSGGCTTTATHNVTIVANPTATINAPANVCANAANNIAAVAAQAGATYAWTITNGTITSASNTSSITFTAGATGNVTLGVTVAVGSCTSTGSANVPIVSGLTVAITGPTSVCPSTPFTLDAGAGFATYAWSNGATTRTITVAQTAATTYSVTVTSGSCSASASKLVGITASPIASIAAPGIIDAGSTGNVASVASQAGATYAWTIGGGTITAGQGTNAITFTAGGSGTVELGVVVTIGGCTASSTASIPIASAVNDADLTVTKSAPATVEPGQTFTYTIQVINNGPSNATNVSISDDLPAGLTLVSVNSGWICNTTATTVRCSGGSAVLGNNAPITITVRAPSQNATITNTATIVSATPDPNPANNSASATTQVVATPLCSSTPPSLVTPADNAVGLASPVTFGWSAVPGATLYELWVGNALAGTTTTTSLISNVASGTTTWYVVARQATGCDALTSARRTFTVIPGTNCNAHVAPQMTAPMLDTNVTSPVTIAWTAAPQAIGYRVFASINGEAAQEVGATDGAISLSANLPPGNVAIFVQALFSGCPPTESERVTFTVTAPDPCANRAAPALVAPPNNAVVNASSVEFRWSDVHADEYRLFASINGAAAQVLGTTEDTSLRAVVDRGDVVWWVQALFDGCPSTESARSRFTIPAPQFCGTDRPNLIAPAHNATVTNAIVTFSWSSVENALQYELWLTQQDGAPTLFGTTAATSLTREVPPGELEWFVRARIDRCDPRDSQKSKFEYVPPANCAANQRPIGDAPADGAEITSPASFRWGAVPGATRYELYVIRGTNAPALAGSSATNALDNVSLATGRLRWFVRAIFGANCPPLDSVAQDLEVIATPQACASLDAPVITAPGQISSGVPFRIRWSPVAGATSYQLLVADNAAFANAESINTNATEHELVRTNAVYARARAIDSRCTPTPTVSLYGPTAVIFILPSATDEPTVPASSRGIVTFTLPLGPELAGQTFTATPTQPWLTVTPASGVVGPTGTVLTVTANTATLPIGASLGSIVITTTTPTVSGVRGNGTTTSTKPVTISLVSPVAPANRNTPPPDALIIPAVANADGINAHFQSDVRVTNASAQAMKYQLTFTPSGEGLTASKQTTISIDAGRTIALDDVLKSWFGTGDVSSTGTLEVRPITQTSNALVKGLANLSSFASSRTFNATSNGTYGQYIPAIPFATFVGKDNAILSLQQIAQSTQYRTNLGIVEASGEPANVLVTVFGQGGAKLTSFPVDLKGGQHTQLNSFLAARGISSLSDGRVEVQVTGGSGKVTAYASVLDNATADPLLVTPVSLSNDGDTKWVVPGVADLRNGLANWQTDLRVFNASSTDVDATLAFYSQNGGEPKTTTLTIPAGQVRELDKTLTSVFNAPNDGGAVHISTSAAARLIATARTYNQTSGGTYGQFISAVTPIEAAAVGTRALQILQVEESTRYRSNIGLAEVSGKSVKLEISIVPPDSKTTAYIQVDLAPNEFRQLGGLLKSLGTEVHNARVTVRAIEGQGRVAAYASVIDMLTQDPTYVPAQ